MTAEEITEQFKKDEQEFNRLMEEAKAMKVPTAKIDKIAHAGTSYSADCPRCGKFKVLSTELKTLRAFCDGCHKPFALVEEVN